MADLPDHVNLGSHRISIDATEATARLLRDEDSRGDSRFDQLLVRLDADRPHTAATETLLHELLHCCWNASALRALEVDEAQELVVTALAPPLLEILRRNPDLVTYLTAP